MRHYDVSELSQVDAYKLLTGVVIPRPIAWVSTISKAGVTNLAPFSFFNAVASNPPTVMFCVSTPPSLQMKDTARNIRETGEFVVSIVQVAAAQVMNDTAAVLPPEVSEIDTGGIETLPSVKVKPPRVKMSPVQLECKLSQMIDVGRTGVDVGSAHLVLGEVIYAHVDESVSDDKLHIDAAALDPLIRLSGPHYAKVRDFFDLPRPAGPAGARPEGK